MDELHLGYGRLAYDPAEDLERVSLDRTRPRVVEAAAVIRSLRGRRVTPDISTAMRRSRPSSLGRCTFRCSNSGEPPGAPGIVIWREHPVKIADPLVPLNQLGQCLHRNGAGIRRRRMAHIRGLIPESDHVIGINFLDQSQQRRIADDCARQQRGIEPFQVERPPPALCLQVAFEAAEGHRGRLDAPNL